MIRAHYEDVCQVYFGRISVGFARPWRKPSLHCMPCRFDVMPPSYTGPDSGWRRGVGHLQAGQATLPFTLPSYFSTHIHLAFSGTPS